MRRLLLQKSIKKAKEHPEHKCVALVQDTIVGFSAFDGARDEDRRNSGEIIAVYVLKDYQRRGIGRALLDACYKALSSYESIIVWVLESNHDAIRFYESEGFDRDGKSKIVLAQKAIRMVKGN